MRSPTLRPALRRPGSLNVVASIFVVALAIEFASTAHAQVPTYDDVGNADEWAQSQILQGLPADFDKRCGGRLDPEKGDDGGRIASQKCRTLPATFLENILKQSPLRDALPDNWVDVHGAKIVGDVRLSVATLKHPLRITNSRFEGKISLDDARSENKIDLTGSSFSDFEASQFHSDSSLRLSGILCKGKLDLQGTQFKGDLDMVDAQVVGDVNANALQVGGALHMRSQDREATFQSVSLIGAKVVGDVDMSPSALMAI